MRFQGKAAYAGPFNGDGVPLLDYGGDIGRQYHPVAIAQYGLARFNSWCETRSRDDRLAWLAAATWLERQLTPNRAGVHVWMHDFHWPYRETLDAPWHSGLAQGSGISLLVRAADATGEWRFAKTAHCAFKALCLDVDAGGVLTTDSSDRLWIEEYPGRPPSHILNGFIWALWGVYDYARFTGAIEVRARFDKCVATIESALPEYDTGHWSLYDLPTGGGTPMTASRYDHELHIAQLRILERITGLSTFKVFADRWQRYLDSRVNRTRALLEKATFKLLHY